MKLDDMENALAIMLAKARTGGSVYMNGAHNPLPTERQKASMFVEDFVRPLMEKLQLAEKFIETLKPTPEDIPCACGYDYDADVCGVHFPFVQKYPDAVDYLRQRGRVESAMCGVCHCPILEAIRKEDRR